jgi:hypothetical protein
LIIKTQKEWQDLWQKHVQGILPAPAIPEIDFDNNMVVAVFMGEKNTSGYAIRISRIEEADDKIYIELEETIPSSDSVVTQQFTQPYHIAVINKN